MFECAKGKLEAKECLDRFVPQSACAGGSQALLQFVFGQKRGRGGSHRCSCSTGVMRVLNVIGYVPNCLEKSEKSGNVFTNLPS